MHYTFEEFFEKAAGFPPYPYQKALAEGEIPDMLSAPTGAGKTEAAVLCMWMWRRMNADARGTRQKTPRRLIYCLPMRTLVEQTKRRIDECIRRLDLDDGVAPRVITIMGGSIDRDYALHPEDDAVIVGTQDMLLSRALNRGYAASPFRWPIEYGLLNNDCMWVMDEVQLMHNGLATSVQLDAFRKRMNTYGPHRTVWMSATIDRRWLNTVDSDVTGMSLTEIGEEDYNNPELKKRSTAVKILRIMDFEKSGEEYKESEAKKIMDVHVDGSLTLVIVNTVKRAQSLYRNIKAMVDGPELLLAHSRFRIQDRKAIIDRLKEIDVQKRNAIVISTQVIEAGIDISAKTLVTENAPWPNLVQRFGRCNRYGEHDDANIHVIMLKPAACPPYDEEEITEAAKIIRRREGGSMAPRNIQFDGKKISYESVIRRSDIIDLFDSSPDISGGYTDVSRYVRSNEKSRDVHVFWKRWNETKPPNYKPDRDEMCSVPIGDIKRKGQMYVYDHAKESWERIRLSDMRPGQTILLHCSYGGYASDDGWNPDSTVDVIELDKGSKDEDSVSGDPQSRSRRLITLSEHTANVVKEMMVINERMRYEGWPTDMLKKAAILHDVGKAHQVFQNAIGDEGANVRGKIWGKSKSMKRYEIRNFRHEAVSAMAILKKAGENADPSTYLMAYVVAAHHGKVRMSMRNASGAVLRGGVEYILGVPTGTKQTIPNFLADGDVAASLKIDGWGEGKLTITSDIAKVGKPSGSHVSWIQMTHKLLAWHGPFRLAYLEAVLRAADSRASAKEETCETK